MQDTCLASIPGIFNLAAELFEYCGMTAWQKCEPAIAMIRTALAPAIENATGSHLPADSVLNPGMGKAGDVVLAEMVAGGLGGMKSMRLLHYILGSSVHFTLLR